jgi:hypothetical protein
MKPIKIQLSDESSKREVELVGKVLCTNAEEYYDTSSGTEEGKFEINKKYDLYKQDINSRILYIVFNEKTGNYANYNNVDKLKDRYYEFKLVE